VLDLIWIKESCMDSVVNLKVWNGDYCIGDHALVTVDIMGEEAIQTESADTCVGLIVQEHEEKGSAVRRKITDWDGFRESCSEVMRLWPSEESKGGGIDDLWSSWLESLNELTNPVVTKPKSSKKQAIGKEEKALANMVQEKNRIRNLRNIAQGSTREELHQQYKEIRNKVKRWIEGMQSRTVSEVNGRIINLGKPEDGEIIGKLY
jgi:hypothetical protein